MFFKEEDFERADWPFLREGSTTLFWNPELYANAISSLKSLHYHILDFSYEGHKKFCEEFSLALKWKEQFGYSPWTGNLNALNDALRGEPLDTAKDSVICIEKFHLCVKEDADWARILLDIFETQSRNYLLRGRRLIILIQTDDPDYFIEHLACNHTRWNHEEWMTKDRG